MCAHAHAAFLFLFLSFFLSFGDLRRGACGEKVLERDSHLLQLKALRPFHEKEICAVQSVAGDLVHAEVFEEIEAVAGPSKPAAFSMAHYKVGVGSTDFHYFCPPKKKVDHRGGLFYGVLPKPVACCCYLPYDE